MIRNKSHPLTALIILSLFSCEEIYYPEVDSMDDVMIVDGIITDQPGRSVIKLRYFSDYDGISEHPLSDATVFVSDNLDNIIPFRDDDLASPGHYLPFGEFVGVPGRIYTLHVETKDGDIYISKPQLIMPAARIEDVNAQYAAREYIRQSYYGRYFRQEVPGIEVFTDLSAENEDILRFRIEPTLLLLYWYDDTEDIPDDEGVDEDDEPIEPEVYYCWQKFSLTDEANVNLHFFDKGYESVKNHLLCFLPDSKFLYNLERNEMIHRKILIIRYYTLNDDAHRFYAESHKQLTSENKLFDPVVSQLAANIICTSNPDKPVAGFFEASSTRCETYALTEIPEAGILEFRRIHDLEYLPDKGSYLNEQPYFW